MSNLLNQKIIANALVVPSDLDASNPPIQFGGGLTGNSGCGFFLKSDGVVGFASGGAEAFNMSSTGISAMTRVSLLNDVTIIQGAGVPVDGTTGLNITGIGSLYSDRTNGDLYINTAVKASPVWKLVTRAA